MGYSCPKWVYQTEQNITNTERKEWLGVGEEWQALILCPDVDNRWLIVAAL